VWVIGLSLLVQYIQHREENLATIVQLILGDWEGDTGGEWASYVCSRGGEEGREGEGAKKKGWDGVLWEEMDNPRVKRNVGRNSWK
jgi:hypothetical protein